jgi:hypothetical protein
MAADEHVGVTLLKTRENSPCIRPGTPSNVQHFELHSLTVPDCSIGKGRPDAMVINVPVHRAHGRHPGEGIGDSQVPDVSRMPDFVHPAQVMQDSVVHPPVGIRYESNAHIGEVGMLSSTFLPKLRP